MARFGARVVAALAGVWLLATAGAFVVFGYRVLGALVTGGSLLPLLVAVGAFALLVGYLSYRSGAKRFLSRLDAMALPRERAPTVHASLDRLAERMRTDRPELYTVNLGQPNAFVLGRDALVVDRSLVRLLGPAELEAILAHELAHLEGHDGLVRSLATSLFRAVTPLALVVLVPLVIVISMGCWGLSLVLGRPISGPDSVGNGLRSTVKRTVMALLVAPTAALRAYSRRQEYAADDRAVAIIDDPLALARALETIQRATEPGGGLLSWLLPDRDRERTPVERTFATHPPTDDRIGRVREAARAAGSKSGRWQRVEFN